MKRESIITKWLRGELSDEEKDHFEKSEEFRLLRKIDASLQDFKSPGLSERDEPEAKTPSNERFLQRKRNRRFRYASIAAAIVLFSLVTVLWMAKPVTDQVVINSSGQDFLYLPDSSSVSLNKASLITYDPQDWESERALTLDGEAFFKVKKGSTFKVKTSQGEISVLGTSFSVTDREDYFEVTCFEGIVSVNFDEYVKTLTRGKSFRSVDHVVTLPDLLDGGESSPAWLRGETRFRSLPVRTVIRDFERQYDVRIYTGDIDTNSIISGSFVHDDIDVAIQGITIPLNCRYKIAEGKITLYK